MYLSARLLQQIPSTKLLQGRDGKGTVFMFAAGNGGDVDDSCAADGYSNSIYTISVGAIDVTGRPAFYDEVCSAKLVSGYVENFEDSLPDVVNSSMNTNLLCSLKGICVVCTWLVSNSNGMLLFGCQ